MSGANYFVSVKQILEAELKIKAASLLKFSGIDQLNLLTSGESASGLKDESHLDQIALDFTNVIVEKGCGNLNLADKNVIYYVTGAVVRSHIRQSKCDSCQKILSDGPLSPLTEENVDGIDDATKVLLQDINRGDPNQKESSSKQIKHRYQTNDKVDKKTFALGSFHVNSPKKNVKECKYQQWISVDRTQLITIIDSKEEFIDRLLRKICDLTRHSYIAKAQTAYMNSLKSCIEPEKEIILQGDFAENFHWENAQTTLHPFVAYHSLPLR
ncbi:hypothetical protein GQR58_028087 [Nymphon striatum]|nr:hypothetical protein GQR58_028087 [Nymphon striatum]